MGQLRVSQELVAKNDTQQYEAAKGADMPAKSGSSETFLKDSMTSMEKVSCDKAEGSIFDTISKSISGLFSSAIEWVWGKNTAKIMPTDEKTEDGMIESITSRPKIEKPQAELERYLDIEKRSNEQIEKIQSNHADDLKTEQTTKKINDAVIMMLLISILKESALSSEREVMFANQRLKSLQIDLEIIRKEKASHDDQVTTYSKAADVAHKIGIVTVALTVGGLVVAAAFIVTGGVAAVPVAVVVANSLVGLAGAFNTAAEMFIKDKLNENKGKSYTHESRQQEVMVQRKLTLEDLMEAYKTITEARKMMAAEARKHQGAFSSIKLV